MAAVEELVYVNARDADSACAPLVAAIIVNHDQWDRVVDQLTGHAATDPTSFEKIDWIVVDNGHSDPPANWIRPSPLFQPIVERVRVIPSANLGYGSAINLAAAFTPARFLLSLNADLLPEPGFLSAVLEAAQELQGQQSGEIDADPLRFIRELSGEDSADERRSHFKRRVAAVGFQLRDADGTKQGSVGRGPTLLRFLIGLLFSRATRKYVFPSERKPSNVDWVTGACMLIDRQCFDMLNGFDEQFFLYYEDVDFCRRARDRGFLVRYDPRGACRHLLPYHVRELTFDMVYVARRSLLLYFYRHRPHWEWRIMCAIVHLECYLRSKDTIWSDIGAMVHRLERDPEHHWICEHNLPADDD